MGCVSKQEAVCNSGELAMVNEHLYFGTSKSDGVVSEQEWADFLQVTVTPKFPQGLTVWQGNGQWQTDEGNVIKEKSYVLNILHEESVQAEQGIKYIISQYTKQFLQESVLRVRDETCVTF